MTRPALLLAAAAVLALLVLPAAAGAQQPYVLVPDRSMAGVELQMTKAEVRDLLGSPTESRTTRDPFGRVTRWYFKGPKVHYYFRMGGDGEPVVLAMFTRRGFVRTDGRVGVGTAESRLRREVDGLTCETFRAQGFRRRSCYTGDFSPGQTVTDFGISRGRVGSVFLGVVID